MLNCVNDLGEACGLYGGGSSSSPYHGTEFSSYGSEQWSTLMYPRSWSSQICYTSDMGRSYGFYSDSPNGRTEGFWEKQGQWGTISYPGAAGSGSIMQTEILGGNNLGYAVGYGETSGGRDDPFVYDVKTDSYQSLRIPGAYSAIAAGYSDNGNEVGYYTDNGHTWDSYSYKDGQLTTYSVPGATMTEINGINDYGQMYGMYEMPGGHTYGFVMYRGQFDTISDPSGGGSTQINGGNNEGTSSASTPRRRGWRGS